MLVLPDEVLLDIFARHDPVGLVRIAAVCRRWRKLCRDQPALFRRVVLGRSSHQDRVTRDVLEWFVGNGTAIRQLDLENCKNLAGGSAGVIARCSGLVSLNLARTMLGHGFDFDFVAIPSGCPALTALTLCQTRVTDASLHAIAAHLPNLVYLDLGGCRQFTAQGVGVLAGLTSLRHLNLHNTLTRGGAGGSTIALAGGCRELRYICLRDCAGIGSAAVDALTTHCPNLKRLDIRGRGSGLVADGAALMQAVDRAIASLDRLLYIKTGAPIVTEASLKKVELTAHDRGWVYHSVGTFSAGEHETDAHHRVPYAEYG